MHLCQAAGVCVEVGFRALLGSPGHPCTASQCLSPTASQVLPIRWKASLFFLRFLLVLFLPECLHYSRPFTLSTHFRTSVSPSSKTGGIFTGIAMNLPIEQRGEADLLLTLSPLSDLESPYKINLSTWLGPFQCPLIKFYYAFLSLLDIFY